MAIPFMHALQDVVDKVRLDVVRHLQDMLLAKEAASIVLTSGQVFNIISQFTDGKNVREVKDSLRSAQIISPRQGYLVKGKAIEAYDIELKVLDSALKNSLS